MIKIGLTGGMGTGKATVARFFGARGAYLVDADEIARSAVMPGKAVWNEIVKRFGKEILEADGSVNRKRLGKIVFGDAEKRALLNSIVHPTVIEEMRILLRRAEAEGRYAVAVANVPLLFEAGIEGEFDRTVVVICSREEQIRRCRARDGLSREEIERRLDAQLPLEEKARRADYVIFDGGSLDDTEKQVEDLWNMLSSPAWK